MSDDPYTLLITLDPTTARLLSRLAELDGLDPAIIAADLLAQSFRGLLPLAYGGDEEDDTQEILGAVFPIVPPAEN